MYIATVLYCNNCMHANFTAYLVKYMYLFNPEKAMGDSGKMRLSINKQ